MNIPTNVCMNAKHTCTVFIILFRWWILLLCRNKWYDAEGSFAPLYMNDNCVFSSPEHKVLMVSYCGQWLSVVRRRVSCVVRRPSSVNI